ncbi:MAG: FixH family protein [Vicinamibacteraceae bacterium]
MAHSQHRLTGLAVLAACLALALAGAQGCRRSPVAEDTDSVLMRTLVLPTSPTVGNARLVITLSGASVATLNQATVTVVGHMTHPGMTPIVAPVTRTEPDVFEAAVDFTMPGSWLLVATVRFPDGRRLESNVPVQVQPRQP